MDTLYQNAEQLDQSLVTSIVQSIGPNGFLSELYIEGEIKQSCVEELIAFLKRKKTVTKLLLHGNKLKFRDVLLIGKFLSKDQSVSHLDIFGKE